jgi:nucleoside-diphosphate-sugar epimerase
MSTSSSRSVIVIGAGVVGEALADHLRRVEPVRSLRVTARTAESVEHLRAQGFDARALDVVVATEEIIAEVVEGFDCVVFSAAAGRGGDYEAIYAGGTAKLARACARSGAHLVYTSSTGVYAARDGEWVEEEAKLAEEDARTCALVAAERNVRDAEGAVLRLSGILARERGPHRRIEALAGTTRDDGEAWVNLAPLPTIVAALAAVIQQRFCSTVNVSGAEPMRRRDFYDVLVAAAGLDPITWTPMPAGADRGRRVDVRRLRERLGIEPMAFDVRWLLS